MPCSCCKAPVGCSAGTLGTSVPSAGAQHRVLGFATSPSLTSCLPRQAPQCQQDQLRAGGRLPGPAEPLAALALRQQDPEPGQGHLHLPAGHPDPVSARGAAGRHPGGMLQRGPFVVAAGAARRWLLVTRCPRRRHLAQNPFVCDCNLKWLADFLRANPIETSGARCASPRRLANKRIGQIKSKKFRCSGERRPRPPLVQPSAPCRALGGADVLFLSAAKEQYFIPGKRQGCWCRTRRPGPAFPLFFGWWGLGVAVPKALGAGSLNRAITPWEQMAPTLPGQISLRIMPPVPPRWAHRGA